MLIRRAFSLSAESNSEASVLFNLLFAHLVCKILLRVRSNDIQEDIVRTFFSCLAALLAAPIVFAQQGPTRPVALTIYNQGFAVARTSIDLDLHAGINELTTTGVTSRLEPDSVVLRDPAGRRIVNIIEQNYDAGSLTSSGCWKNTRARPSTSRPATGRLFRAELFVRAALKASR